MASFTVNFVHKNNMKELKEDGKNIVRTHNYYTLTITNVKIIPSKNLLRHIL